MHNIDISEFDIKNEVSEKYKEKKVKTIIPNIIIVVGILALILCFLGFCYWSGLIFSLGFVLNLIVLIAGTIYEYYDRNYFKHKIYFYYTNNQLLSFYKEYDRLYFNFSDNGLVKEKISSLF